MVSPSIKLRKMSRLLFPVNGKTKINNGYKYGLMYPKKLM